jgi:hypothetical protein
VRPSGPGIASANRPRLGPFAELLRQIRHDQTALDALVFAYTALDGAGRRALIHALHQDAQHPTQGLGAFLVVERNPELRRHLAQLIREDGRIERSAVLQGSAARGEARLIQSLSGFWPEALRVRWSRSKIDCIEIEARADLRIESPASPLVVAEVVDTLAPLVWRHIREGGHLPQGVGRFAGFFSLA